MLVPLPSQSDRHQNKVSCMEEHVNLGVIAIVCASLARRKSQGEIRSCPVDTQFSIIGGFLHFSFLGRVSAGDLELGHVLLFPIETKLTAHYWLTTIAIVSPGSAGPINRKVKFVSIKNGCVFAASFTNDARG